MKYYLILLTLIIINGCQKELKKPTEEIIIATTKNRSLLNSFIANPESVQDFKDGISGKFGYTCYPVLIDNFSDSAHICYKFSYNRFDEKYFETKEKPNGPVVLEIISLRDIRNNNLANDYFDKSEIILGFTIYDTINSISYTKLIGKDTSYLKSNFGGFDHKAEGYVEYNVADNKLILYYDDLKINKIEFKKVK